MVSEKAAVCVRAERVLNGCCHVCVCSRGVGERGVAEAVANEKKKCVARRERRVMWCSVNVCETSREDGKWAAAAGVRWKFVCVSSRYKLHVWELTAERVEVEAAASIERGGCVVCKAAAAVEVRAAACSTNQPRARHHRAPLSHVGSFGRAHAPSARRMPRSVGGRSVGG